MLLRQCAVGIQRLRAERLLQPRQPKLAEMLCPRQRWGRIVAPDHARIKEQDAVLAQALARRAHVRHVLSDRALAEGAPAKLGGAKALLPYRAGLGIGL